MKTDTIDWGPIDDQLLDKLDAAVESYSGSPHPGMQELAEVIDRLRAECEAVVVSDLWHDVVLCRDVIETSQNWDDVFAPIYSHAYPWEVRHEATTDPHARMIQETMRGHTL